VRINEGSRALRGLIGLGAGGTKMETVATNRANFALPFGLGFHPWLPRTPATRLMAQAESVWLEDARHLPVKRVAVTSRPEWDFSSLRSLPIDWINNAFVGWNGHATILWEDRALALDLEARPRSQLLSSTRLPPMLDSSALNR
jgi:aldose 1-epimerase